MFFKFIFFNNKNKKKRFPLIHRVNLYNIGHYIKWDKKDFFILKLRFQQKKKDSHFFLYHPSCLPSIPFHFHCFFFFWFGRDSCQMFSEQNKNRKIPKTFVYFFFSKVSKVSAFKNNFLNS